ncbi:MAG: hypothetical protein ACFE0O_02760 [Opitutales bacterium]
MPKTAPKLSWCRVRLGEDMNWWVEEISDEVHWDVDGLSILDPRQIQYILELIEPLTEYGYQESLFEAAFYPFTIKTELKDGKIELARSNESFLESDEPMFALPDVMDEEKGPYADFLNHITRLRVKLLNDLIDFKQNLTVDELEEEIRENENNEFMEGRAVHFFTEITSILEYVPEGYELDKEEVEDTDDDEEEEIDEDFPDVEESEEKIEEDETMKWDDDEDEETEDENEETEDEEKEK